MMRPQIVSHLAAAAYEPSDRQTPLVRITAQSLTSGQATLPTHDYTWGRSRPDLRPVVPGNRWQ